MKAVPAIEGRFQDSVRHGRRWFTPLLGTLSPREALTQPPKDSFFDLHHKASGFEAPPP